MFILFSKMKEKTNAYGGRGRRDKLFLCDRKQWGLWKTWTWFLKTAQPTNWCEIEGSVYIEGLTVCGIIYHKYTNHMLRLKMQSNTSIKHLQASK